MVLSGQGLIQDRPMAMATKDSVRALKRPFQKLRDVSATLLSSPHSHAASKDALGELLQLQKAEHDWLMVLDKEDKLHFLASQKLPPEPIADFKARGLSLEEV